MDNVKTLQLGVNAIIEKCDNISKTDEGSDVSGTVGFPLLKFGYVGNTDCDGRHLSIVCIHRSQSFSKRLADSVEIAWFGCHAFLYLNIRWISFDHLGAARKYEALAAFCLCGGKHVVSAHDVHWKQ